MKKKTIITLTCLLITAGVYSQSIWNTAHLKQVKQHLAEPAYAIAYQELIKEADKTLQQAPLSVLMKEKTPPSGDKHDYMSQARYSWPDPSKPDGKPYINRDGLSNPEIEKLDRNRLGSMANNVTTLSLAWYFSGNEQYAQKAAQQLRVWFLDKATRMNPNLNYAQLIPGQNGDKGRCYGVIDTYSFVEMLDAVKLLEQSASFTPKEAKHLKVWFGQLLHWILTSEQGREEARQKNNHSIAHDAQAIVFALYIGDQKTARQILNEFPEKRIYKQVEPDGKQPHELTRTLAFGYSEYNLQHMIDIAVIGQKMGLSIDKATSKDGRSLYCAADFLTPYLGKDVTKWPYKQISGWQGKQQELCKDLYRLYILNPSRTDYLKLYKEHRIIDWKDRFTLLFTRPDETENVFAFASTQLDYAIGCTEKARRENQNKKKVSPRTVEKDGSLRLVSPHDWCSGFFPGSLWQLYAYTRNNHWQQEADKHTWLVEEAKMHKGTHDLGFMIYCPFGQGYKLTGKDSYREVIMQAAKTLSTRYNPKVKAIRSWDFNRQNWLYPVIIDNMLNLELLFRATQLSGDSVYHQIAVNHANTTLANHFRPDASSYHVIDYDTLTGFPRLKCTKQGIADESVWSRGQAWGLYGYTMSYRFTRNPVYLQQAEKIARYFFHLPNLPKDLIPYWDMQDPAIPDAPRDASAAAIFASGLYELSSHLSTESSKQYKTIADRILKSLNEHYQAGKGTAQGFLLLHSTGNYPANDEIDAPISYADYYYLEALLRKEKLEDSTIIN